MVNEEVTSFADSNWGSQDQSISNPQAPPKQLQPFTIHSISGFLVYYMGPIYWSWRRQTSTAQSSAESDIYATNECIKYLQYLRNILQDIHLHSIIIPKPLKIYNDNKACIDWSKTTTDKGLRHITIRENSVRESVQKKKVEIIHIEGIINPSDIFTKEISRNAQHFIQIRDILVTEPDKQTPIQVWIQEQEQATENMKIDEINLYIHDSMPFQHRLDMGVLDE